MRFPPISRRAPRKSGITSTILGAVVAVSLAAALPSQAPAQDQGSALIEVLTNGKKSKDTRTIVESTNARLLFSKDIKKGETPPGVIIGNSKVLKPVAGAAQERALLLEAGEVGRTSVTVTFADGSIEQYLFTVTRDLSMLENALKSIHPSIEATIAPDRDAIVITGLVPDGTFAARAVAATNDYVSAKVSAEKGQGKVINLIRVQEAISNLEQRLSAEIERLGATGVSVRRIQQGPVTDDTRDIFVISGSTPDVNALQSATALVRAAVGDAEGKRVVSQLQSSDRPTSIEEVIQNAIREQVGAANVKVSRVAQVDATGDTDVLVLTGTVPSQTALVRALTLASKVFQQQEIVKRKRAGEIERVTETFAGGLTRTTETPLEVTNSADDIKVAADESGALRKEASHAQTFEQSNLSTILSGSNSNSGANFGSDVSSLLNNGLDQNIARAKAVELADGRILSFLTVEDLPQVRVEIKLYEVNRNALLQWDSNLRGLAIADFNLSVNNPSPLNSNGDALFPPANGAAALGQSGNDVYNVVSFLEGTLTNQLQVGGGHFALDSVFRLLEREGLARTLSSPSLTVLSGEVAAFGDGGSVPETRTVSTGAAGSTGVFSGSEQRDFGVQLAVRPLVDDKGFITLDVVPSVSEPDLILTALLRNTTGSPQNSIAFSKRSLRTSARMRDGDVLLIGGLTQHSRKDDTEGTPFLSDIPLIGWMFKDKKFDDSDRELVISVNPTILRDRIDSVHLWEYPSARELLKRPPRPQQQQQQQPNAGAAPAQTAAKQ